MDREQDAKGTSEVIRVEPAPEPETFDAECRQPGNAWLKANPDRDPRTRGKLWRGFRQDLREAFHRRCGFLAFWISPGAGTVDHFAPISTHRSLAFEWRNYRYIDGDINSSKGAVPCDKLLDPFEVQDDWFEIDLPSMELRFVGDVPDDVRIRAEFTLDRLGLRNGDSVVAGRQEWLDEYEEYDQTLAWLYAKAPLIA
ncbi:MAG: hypothetical protein FWD57_12090, partial [Polyangiaceae bacterium]|nr:hypothetical protein [Polyangiaceae bacterium]